MNSNSHLDLALRLDCSLHLHCCLNGRLHSFREKSHHSITDVFIYESVVISHEWGNVLIDMIEKGENFLRGFTLRISSKFSNV